MKPKTTYQPTRKSSKRTVEVAHREQVFRQLRDLGVSRWGLVSMEVQYLPQVLHAHEAIGGVVYGLYEGGFAMLVATDRRIIFLDKKPLFINEDEINYLVVSGVGYGHVGWGTTVTLHTRVHDYTIRTFNQKCAEGFREFIEARCLEQEGQDYDQHT